MTDTPLTAPDVNLLANIGYKYALETMTTEQLRARVAELEAAGKLLATQGREMATGLCSDTREVGATGVCVACQVRMVRYLEVWRAALEGKR